MCPPAARVFYRGGELDRGRRGRADPVSPLSRRVRLSVLQPGSQPDRARERGAGDRDRSTIRFHPKRSLPWWGSGDRLDHFPAQLSGGEQQRVAIARAVAKRPDILLCDEPTGALDYATGKLVLSAIDLVNRELGTTTVVITHNAPIAAMGDRVITLGDGLIVGEQRNRSKTSVGSLRW